MFGRACVDAAAVKDAGTKGDGWDETNGHDGMMSIVTVDWLISCQSCAFSLDGLARAGSKDEQMY